MLFGILLVPLAYLIVWELVQSVSAALLSATIILCGELCYYYMCIAWTNTGSLEYLITLAVAHVFDVSNMYMYVCERTCTIMVYMFQMRCLFALYYTCIIHTL